MDETERMLREQIKRLIDAGEEMKARWVVVEDDALRAWEHEVRSARATEREKE